jgi:hypothetical protein
MANATLRYQTKSKSCTSSNPKNPDMANATLRYQTKSKSCKSFNPKNPDSDKILI